MVLQGRKEPRCNDEKSPASAISCGAGTQIPLESRAICPFPRSFSLFDIEHTAVRSSAYHSITTSYAGRLSPCASEVRGAEGPRDQCQGALCRLRANHGTDIKIESWHRCQKRIFPASQPICRW